MIDLLPTSEKIAIRKEYHLRVLTVCFATLSLVLLVLVASFLPTYLYTLSRYEAFLTESESDETQSRISQMKEMETTVGDTNKKIEALKGGAATMRVKDVVFEILESKSHGLVVTAISYDFGGNVSKKGKEDIINPATININGKASDRATLLAFKDALSQKKEFGTIDLPISNLVKDTDISFSINLSVAPGVSGKIK